MNEVTTNKALSLLLLLLFIFSFHTPLSFEPTRELSNRRRFDFTHSHTSKLSFPRLMPDGESSAVAGGQVSMEPSLSLSDQLQSLSLSQVKNHDDSVKKDPRKIARR